MNSDTTKLQKPVNPIWKWLAGCGVIASLALVGLRMYGTYVMPSEIPKRIAEWESTHVELPESWHQPADLPSEESVELHRALSVEMDALRHNYKEFLFGADHRSGLVGGNAYPTVLEDQRSTFSAIMTELQPLIERASEVVTSPGYIFDTDTLLADNAVSSYDVSVFATLLLIQAKEHALGGECNAAIETATLALRLLKRPEQANELIHSLSVEVARLGAITIYEICDQYTDTTSIQNVLDTLNELRDTALTDVTNLRYSELLGPLRYAAAYGYPIDLSPKSYAEFQRQNIMLSRGDYYRWIIGHMPLQSEQVRSARANLNRRNEPVKLTFSIRETAWNIFRTPVIIKLATGYDLEMLKKADRYSNDSFYKNQAAIATSIYDLARIELARRLADLNDNGTTISDYLSPIPKDPFTSAPYRYSKTVDRYYGVGQDGIDHHATMKFDYYYPDGLGDIWLESEPGRVQ